MIIIGTAPLRKPRAWLFWLAVLGPFVACGLYVLLMQWAMVWSRTSKEHFYPLQEPPPFLTEALALEKAKETLAAEGYPPANWEPAEDDRSKAPDGTPDRWFQRNGLNSERGIFMFRHREDWKQGKVTERIVSVELRGKQIVCRVIRPL